MEDKKLDRREFLKLAIASAAATGLSHFQILNVGRGVAFAAECESGEDPDKCNASGAQDMCMPEDPDFCPDPSGAGDMCAPDPYEAGSDVCDPEGVLGEPDICQPGIDPDVCVGPSAEGDICEPSQGEADLNTDDCTTTGQDLCEPLLGNPDMCEPLLAIEDTCWPGDPINFDLCPEAQIGGAWDICDPVIGEADKCLPMDPYNEPDECKPAEGDPDECNTTVGDIDIPPTAVELASLGTRRTGQGVLLEWETASEVDSLGFNVYRSRSARSGYQQLNTDLIPCRSPGGVTGAGYRFLDGQAQPSLAYYYVLETVDVHGGVERYGPVQASPVQRLVPARRRPLPGGSDPRIR